MTDTVATGVITAETTTTVIDPERTTTITITETPSTVTGRPTLRDGSGNPALATVVRIRWGQAPKTSYRTVITIAIAVPVIVVFLTLCIILLVCWRRHAAAGFIIPEGPELDAEDSRVNEIEGVEYTPVRHELDGQIAALESERVEREVVPEPEEIGLERLRAVGNVGGTAARLTAAELLDVLTRPEGVEESVSMTESGPSVARLGGAVV